MNKVDRFRLSGKWKILFPVLAAFMLFASLSFRGQRAGMDEFFKVYEGKAMVGEVRNGFRFSSMVMTPEYLAASRLRGNAEPSSAELEKAKSYYRDGIRVLVKIRNENAAARPGQAEGDLLYSALGKGRGHFAEALSLWQNGMKEMVFLQDKQGRKIPPVGHHYMRRWELGNEETFLLTFPDSLEGKPVKISECTLRFKEFGLSTGNLALQLIRPPSLRVRI